MRARRAPPAARPRALTRLTPPPAPTRPPPGPAGLPQEALWLKRFGMRLVMSLPCVHAGKVVAVLTVATKSSTLNQL